MSICCQGFELSASLAAATIWGDVGAAAYITVVAMICAYGLHRYWLLYLYVRHRREAPSPRARYDDLPRVTVQLPLYNEGAVAAGVLDAAAALDYPADRLQIQVLDDSTDESAAWVEARCAHHRRLGVPMEYVHRRDRRGYKAGALADAMPAATGELIAIFDADFRPPADFLQQTVHYFTDPQVGLVQARWGHLNKTQSLLTRAQAIFLDGHFAVEQAARCRSGRFFHFNGTAGVWRRQAIDDAGGWSASTLCEDLDLSIRTQMRGWRFLYLQDVVCPAELPPVVPAFKQQQFRWFKGTTQVMLKLLPSILRAPLPLKVKGELACQLTGPAIAVLLVLFSLGFYPALMTHVTQDMPLLWTVATLLLGVFAGAVFYAASQVIIGGSAWYGLAMVPLMISVGIGIAVTNSRGIIEALLGVSSPFVRTPKFGDHTARAAPGLFEAPSLRRVTAWATPLLELVFAAYLVACLAGAVHAPYALFTVPLLTLFALGYAWFGGSSLWHLLRTLRPTPPAASIATSAAANAAQPQPV